MTNQRYSEQFKRDAVRLVTYEGCLYAFCRSPNHGGFYWLAGQAHALVHAAWRSY